MSLLEVRGLSVRFRAAHAVRGVDLDVGAGECLALVGESGSGKSVTARALLGLLPPTAEIAGRAVFDGIDLQITSGRRSPVVGSRLTTVFQDPMRALNPVLRIGDQITEVLRLHAGMSRAAARVRAEELLAAVGMADPGRRLRAYPHELSGGMRQRVCIAIAIACRPALVLADEPTTALDVTVQRQILDLVDELRRASGMAMVLITHDLAVVAGRADRVAVMRAGEIVESGPTRDVFTAPRHPYTAALLDAVPRIDGPRAAAVVEGSAVEGVR
ncbi:peptide/nickel transport system ATP-binding protein [Pseudonocardia thermophila]|jgi:ABC-type dipeptide/oligopeptide/nickel transport system, ATPase component|uniref:Peptide/nickel transport system ATP-binding protein n=1 Tax=Pseudonocardia thermophila TaxID=1848 RepID=A0A1M6UYQ8_PSETH|nr:ABC transporter ATP-binding protein [Pseudonocardia thermophila]SHK74320.1 peptide/nickel transport system ATP-binding protein [Pseudonocardia thermophila]